MLTSLPTHSLVAHRTSAGARDDVGVGVAHAAGELGVTACLCEYGRRAPPSMSAPELVLTRRAEIVHALCSGGSAEPLEQVLDLLLSRGQLQEEEYHSVQAPGRALYACARQLLDLVSAKGADACALLCAALAQALP